MLFIGATITRPDRVESVVLVKTPGSIVALKSVKTYRRRQLAFGMSQQHCSDATSKIRRSHIELFNPTKIAVSRHSYETDDDVLNARHGYVSCWNQLTNDPLVHRSIRMNQRRARDEFFSRTEIHLSDSDRIRLCRGAKIECHTRASQP